MILKTVNLTKSFGRLQALTGVNLVVENGEIFGIAGPNGAGKSTLFNVIAGTFPPTGGQVLFDGHDITKLPAHRICRLGLARTFQIPQTFQTLSVHDNIRVGATFGGRAEGVGKRIDAVLDFLNLTPVRNQTASNLDLYTTKMVMLAASLATGAKLLMLDEPLAGLSAAEIEDFLQVVRRVNRENRMTVIMIEHILDALISVSSRMMVLDNGTVIYTGEPEGVRRDPHVIEVYLGDGDVGSGGGGIMTDRAAPALVLENVNGGYGELPVLRQASLTINEGEVVALFGPNGHGKSTLLKAISGIHPARGGSIRFRGREIARTPSERIVEMGLAYIPEARNLFPEMTVLENLRLGAFNRRARSSMEGNLGRVFTLFPRLAERRDQVASTLSGGESRMLAVGRGLMGRRVAAAHRRTLHRAVAVDEKDGVRRHPPHPRRNGHRHPDRGAGGGLSPGPGRPHLSAEKRPGHPGKGGGGDHQGRNRKSLFLTPPGGVRRRGAGGRRADRTGPGGVPSNS